MTQSRLISREPPFPPKDTPLREDVRRLGALVGEVIREQGGEALFHRVEDARRTAIARREGDPQAEAGLDRLIEHPSAAEVAELVRAFSTYFQVVNIAERVHRIRRRRDYARDSARPQPRSVADTINQLREQGVRFEQLGELLNELSVEPVMTAHPSEATRKTLLEKHRRIAQALLDQLDTSLPPERREELLQGIRDEVTAAWQTSEHSRQRPTVADELENVLYHVADVIYRVTPYFYEALEAALANAYGPEAEGVQIPTVLRFASWVGGDMDGNPNVTAETIRESLARHRSVAVRLYLEELADLYQKLSQSESRAGFDPRLLERCREYGARFPQVLESVPSRHTDMPYRVFVRLIGARLRALRAQTSGAYEAPEEFSGDLRLVAGSLEANRGKHAGWRTVTRLIRRADTFGFHLLTLDVRQDSAVHRSVAGRGLGIEGWEDLPAAERTERLKQALGGKLTPPVALDGSGEATLEVFRAIGECRRLYGPRAIGPYIISMAEDVDDVLSVILLARWAGLSDEQDGVPLDIAPLFETGADLRRAAGVMERLLADPLYRGHLGVRHGRQIVMVGYSDSNKDAGPAASRWLIQRAQEELAAVTRQAGVELTVFHGRGGTPGRGGGKTYRGILAAPPQAVRGRLRVTEQGEVISEKYSLGEIALRNLEQAASAVMLASETSPEQSDPPARWREVMDAAVDRSREAYHALVHEQPGFFEYFRSATPIDVIERMPIGSRPPSRRAAKGIRDLRAIPWVFSWTQSRHLLPGWFGVGSGLEAAIASHGEETLAEMMREWRFLRAFIDDVELSLAKADMTIAARYATLSGPEGAAVFDRIRSEYDRTVECVLRLKSATDLLSEDLALQRSIRLRNPYVDPMSFLQADLLRRWRAAGRPDDDNFHALMATVTGIARGLQNTG